MDLGLRDRACIITGASAGIGAATAVTLAAEGAALVLVARGRDALQETANACRQRGAAGVRTLALDVTVEAAGREAVGDCIDAFGRIDVLVNNAGGSGLRTLGELRDDDWQAQWELNVMAPMRFMQAAAPQMASREWGRIVNVSSSAGKRPSRINMAYAVTKAAQLSLSRSFAELYASQGVIVNAVAPGPTDTGAWLDAGGLADQFARLGGSTREEVLAERAAAVPLGRFGTSGEVAAVIAFLCSEQAANVVGAAWSADGGAVSVII
jgi:3-oxoacyl-[acyl-carrier protein] reductase